MESCHKLDYGYHIMKQAFAAVAVIAFASALPGCGDDTDEPTAAGTTTATASSSRPAGAETPKDFREIGRYPGSTISSWGLQGEIIDCEGVGPVAEYEKWTIEYDSPAGTVGRDILNYYRGKLTAEGWSLSWSASDNIHLIRGTAGNSICYPDGRQDQVDIKTTPVECTEDCGAYSLYLILPRGSDPF